MYASVCCICICTMHKFVRFHAQLSCNDWENLHVISKTKIMYNYLARSIIKEKKTGLFFSSVVLCLPGKHRALNSIYSMARGRQKRGIPYLCLFISSICNNSIYQFWELVRIYTPIAAPLYETVETQNIIHIHSSDLHEPDDLQGYS